jgi:hypothetical protein
MPIAAIAAIASLAAAGVGTGLSIDSALNQPGAPKVPTTTPTTPLTSSQNAATTAAVGQQLPTLQALTGGSVSPEYAANFGATGAGVNNTPGASGDVQAAVNQFFGLSAPGSSGLTTPTGASSPGGNPLTDIIARLTRGGGSDGGGSLVNNVLGGDDFKGLATA